MREGRKDSGKSHGGVEWRQNILVTFLAVARYLRMAKGEKVYLGSQCEGIAHHGKDTMSAR